MLLLVLHVREELASGDSELVAFELFLDEKVLATSQLAEGCTPQIVQAALLPVAGGAGGGGNTTPGAAGGSGIVIIAYPTS